MSRSTPVDQSLAGVLFASANATGGWGYYRGKTSRIEPTSWALLALTATAGRDLEPHRRFLLSCQRASGLLVEDPALPPNIAFNALAAIAMLGELRAFGDAPLGRLLDALVRQKGQAVGPSPHFRQNNALQGWSWIDGTFSWVEPTSWALLALKVARRGGLAPSSANDRIREAEELLIDRCCRDGGWNYGNANVFGKDLEPHVPTTALALLAMQDRRDVPAVMRSVAYLESHWAAESSTIGLALTSICLQQYSRPVDEIADRLDRQREITQQVGNLHSMAVAHYSTLPLDRVDSLAV